MPPVRDASTKPMAATVLPAPVACSNQNRLWALGSSGASGSCSSSASFSASQSSGSSSSGTSSSTASSPGIAGEPSVSGAGAPLLPPFTGGAAPLEPRCASARSAVNVPESAST